MSDESGGDDCRREVRSNYFQTEFTVSVKKGRAVESGTSSAPGRHDERKKVSISIQTANRSMVGADDIPKERKRWVRPPVVGQASPAPDSKLSIVPVSEDDDDSNDEIIESSQEPFVSTVDYPNRKDFISEKPPEGSCSAFPDNRVPSPASASSLASGRPLEWDSGADVGYFQAYPDDKGLDPLSSLERMALGGSTSLLTRSDPEGTVSNSVAPLPIPSSTVNKSNVLNAQNQILSPSATLNIIGVPDAESTPNLPPFKTSVFRNKNPELSSASKLFPEVVGPQCYQASDANKNSTKLEENISKNDLGSKRSSSLEDVGTCNQQPTPFVRSQSQSNINTNMRAQLQSNSSSSLNTVVKGNQKLHSSTKKESESDSGADGRANSFEYLPGTVFDKPGLEQSSSNDLLKSDIERGVKLISDFVKGTQANNTILKKKLLQKVVEELVSKTYPGEEAWSSGSSHVHVSCHKKNASVAPTNPPSAWQGLPSVPEGAEKSDGRLWPVNSWPLGLGNERCVTRRGHSEELQQVENYGESDSRASHFARIDAADKPSGTSGSTLETSSVSEPSIKQHKQPLPGFRRRMIDKKSLSKDKLECENSSSSDWKVPATKTEKIYDQLKKKGPIEILDPGVLRYLQCERENQVEWIKKEIDHLSNLKGLLEMHETLRKNVNNLKKTREKKGISTSTDYKASRPKRKSAISTRSEPLGTKKNLEDFSSESSWCSHDYGVNLKGILKKNASTNTSISKKEVQPELLKKAISYTILFDKDKKDEKIFLSNAHINTKYPTSKITGVNIADRDTLLKESRERIREQLCLNLQNELINNKPDYVARAEMRRQTVADLMAIREVREKNRQQMLAAAITHEPAPFFPTALGVRRVVSQKSMRQLTERNYKRSAIVQQQHCERKRKEQMVTNRLMAEIFNRNLQKRVLKGETYLSNSVNVI